MNVIGISLFSLNTVLCLINLAFFFNVGNTWSLGVAVFNLIVALLILWALAQ